MNNACFIFRKCLENQYPDLLSICNSTIINLEDSLNYSAISEKNSWMDLCWFPGFLIDFNLGCFGLRVTVTSLLCLKSL